MLYAVIVAGYTSNKAQVELFTSQKDAIKLAKHLMHVVCEDPRDLEEFEYPGETLGYYAVYKDISVSVQRKFIDVCTKEDIWTLLPY